MSTKHNKSQETARLATKLCELVQIFRQVGKANDFRWWHGQSGHSLFNPRYGYQDGQPLFVEVVQGILRLNSEMLSEHEIETRIMFDFLMGQTTDWSQPNHLNNQSLVDGAK